ncbi:hypothetical protein [Nonomuraea sp. SYSU D8015]|uniref:hypothetical protein n=1 Tax=Nonomuraea sp. SYSU D8015 TaxID=2593644 RepID=UPI0016614D9F|nr:hypothetical protein [Nonomuraea sp. SYSU D8015]
MARWHFRRGGSGLRRAPEPRRFVPSDVDEAAALSEITRLVEELAPGGVDEATGHPLDNLINSTAARWEQEVQAEYAAYHAEATALVGVADAAVAECRLAEADDRERLADVRLALDAASSRLVQPGDGPTEGAAPASATDSPSETGSPGRGDPAGEGASPGGGDLPGRGRFVRWGGRQYADPTLLAGWPRVPLLLHTAALAAAAGADWAAFLQVVKLIMRSESALTTSVVVVGFTAIVVYLAHATGVMCRDIRAGSAEVSRALAALCVLAWAAFGAAAFVARLRAAEPRQAFSDATSPSDDSALFSALFFLAFFVGTGIVAGAGAYLTHNPLRSAYGRALRVHRRMLRRAIVSARELALAEANRSAHASELMAARQSLLHALQVRLALAERLKQMARVLIAQRAQDPAVTDAILEPDLRPYAWSPGTAGSTTPPARSTS